MKKLILSTMTATMLITAVPAYAWSTDHCQTAVGATRAQQGKLLKECVGKFSQAKYGEILLNYINGNGGFDNYEKMPLRVQKVIRKADSALLDDHIKWMEQDSQEFLDEVKLAGLIAGPILAAALLTATVAAVTPGLFLLAPTQAGSPPAPVTGLTLTGPMVL